jgi:hypothetical protein
MHACIYITHLYNRGKQEGEKERHEEGRKEEPKCERERWGENKRAKRGKKGGRGVREEKGVLRRREEKRREKGACNYKRMRKGR